MKYGGLDCTFKFTVCCTAALIGVLKRSTGSLHFGICHDEVHTMVFYKVLYGRCVLKIVAENVIVCIVLCRGGVSV